MAQEASKKNDAAETKVDAQVLFFIERKDGGGVFHKRNLYFQEYSPKG